MREEEMTGDPQAPTNQPQADAEIFDATLVTRSAAQEGEIRTGSPFRGEAQTAPSLIGASVPLVPGYDPLKDGSAAFERGVLASTAWGGVLAAFCALPFAIICAWVFPLGALLVAGLGCVLAVFGLSSQRAVPTVVVLLGHLAAGVFGYIQLL